MGELPTGKGIMIWKGKTYGDGTVEAAVQACQEMGLRWVALKIGDAANTTYQSYADMPAAVKAFRAAGMKVWGWHYIYGGIWIDKLGVVHVEGASPSQEAAFAKSRVSALGLDGYLIDAEREYKVYSQAERAKSFMAGLAGIGVPVGLCSYRFPTLHATFPWKEFLAGCQFHAPQVYHGPLRGIIDLERSMLELRALKDLPFAPVGRAYIGDGYAEPGPSGEEINGFLGHAELKGCTGASFWALDFLWTHVGGDLRKLAIGAYAWSGDQDPEPEPEPEECLEVIGKVTVTANVLNIRRGPGTMYSDTGDTILSGTWYAFEKIGDWARIGENAWVMTGLGYAEWM
jgi:hypothetical protein